ncbi:putative papain-like cysteine peptidase superfamily [Helianthus annuus]|nr:putative papain-like cysteine peptidase superfamily [Helianthus annuus]
MDDKRVGIYFDIFFIFYRAMAVYASESGANIRVKLVWINARCPRQPGGTECGYYVMKFMKEIAYEGVEILDNDNVSLGIF